MSKKFTEYSQLNLSEINKEVLKKWDENDVFSKSMTEREGYPSFVFYEGPPSANGMPGIHHVMARTIKDTFCRFKTMKGFQVKRKAGWDTHGLPVELGVEKALGITKEDIGKTISVADYNKHCRTDVMKFTKEWTDLTHKMGYWVDLENPYITYDNRYIETLWWLLQQLYKKGLLYKGYTIQPYSPAAGTGLSSHELNQPGCYRDVKDLTVVGQFKMKNPKPEMAEGKERVATKEEIIAFCEHEIELLNNKRSGSGKPTKTQIENEKIMETIYSVLGNAGVGMTISEMMKTDELNAYSNQKLSALCKKMYENERIQKKIIKKKSFFAVKGVEITEK